ncbi:unnamed protein product [Lathyrus sativus]|nr:unnamed protein product [Lathyrus sativus]
MSKTLHQRGHRFKDYYDSMASLASNMLGSESRPESNNFLEPAFTSDLAIYYVQTKCTQDNILFPLIYQVGGTDVHHHMETFPYTIAGFHVDKEIECIDVIKFWRNSSSEINNELYEGHERSFPQQINTIFSAFDFLYPNGNGFNVTVWYKSTYKDVTNFGPTALL